MHYFIANWKARLTLTQIQDWLQVFSTEIKANHQLLHKLDTNLIQIVICPPFPFLAIVKEKLPALPHIMLGSQDLSQFDNGNYTGETTGRMLADFIQYAIIGHSERRQYLHEDENNLAQKYQQATNNKIKPVFCIRNEQDLIPDNCQFVAYEPVAAIGTGVNEDPEKVILMKKKLNLSAATAFIYGGSVNDKNIPTYLNTQVINGFLIGKASLDPQQFITIIQQAN